MDWREAFDRLFGGVPNEPMSPGTRTLLERRDKNDREKFLAGAKWLGDEVNAVTECCCSCCKLVRETIKYELEMKG